MQRSAPRPALSMAAAIAVEKARHAFLAKANLSSELRALVMEHPQFRPQRVEAALRAHNNDMEQARDVLESMQHLTNIDFESKMNAAATPRTPAEQGGGTRKDSSSDADTRATLLPSLATRDDAASRRRSCGESSGGADDAASRRRSCGESGAEAASRRRSGGESSGGAEATSRRRSCGESSGGTEATSRRRNEGRGDSTRTRAPPRQSRKSCGHAADGAGEAASAAAVAAAQGGRIDPLVALVRDGSEEQKTIASGALWNLAVNDNQSVRAAIAEAGAIPPLIALVRNGVGKQREYGAGTLRHLAREGDAMSEANQLTIAQAGGIPPLVALVRDGTEDEKARAAGALRNLACHEHSRLAIAEAGGIGPLVVLARGGSSMEEKAHASGVLRHLAEHPALRQSVEDAGFT